MPDGSTKASWPLYRSWDAKHSATRVPMPTPSPAKRRSPEPIDFGFVGDPDANDINTDFLSLLIENKITPVFCAITHDGNGSLLNTNADTVGLFAGKRPMPKLSYHLILLLRKRRCAEKRRRSASRIASMNKAEYESYKKRGDHCRRHDSQTR